MTNKQPLTTDQATLAQAILVAIDHYGAATAAQFDHPATWPMPAWGLPQDEAQRQAEARRLAWVEKGKALENAALAAIAARDLALAAMASALAPGAYQWGSFVIERGRKACGQWHCEGYGEIAIYEPREGGSHMHLLAAWWDIDKWRAEQKAQQAAA